jgi:hypothetical protein
MKNYKIVFDGSYSSIEKTDKPPDENEIFPTLKEAKQELINYLDRRAKDFKGAIAGVRAIKESNF